MRSTAGARSIGSNLLTEIDSPMDSSSAPRKSIPIATYRLQLHAGFGFDDAARVAEYLKDLGISHIYCSPYLQAAPGSMHGYDVVDPEKVNEELGGEAGLERFTRRLKELGLGQILDIVPNHMASGPQNRYWWDVLENGQASRFADRFDIDWQSSEVKLQNKILIPVLGDQYGRALSAGEIKLDRQGEAFIVRYFDHTFPLAPQSLSRILWRAASHSPDNMMSFIADSFARLPSPESADPEAASTRHRDKTVIYGLLDRLCKEHPDVCESIDGAIADLNRDIDQLDEILNQQNYRLAFWRTADQELGYRRFFDVNTLIGVRVEREHVFRATHRLIFEWLAGGALDGVRIDHPDGLRDPQQYFDRLRARVPSAWVVAEKILEPAEPLRREWPIDGTSGYDFLNLCNRLLIFDEGLTELTGYYRRLTGEKQDFDKLAIEKKLNVAHEALGSDVNRLATLFVSICENNRDRRDYTRAEIRRAIREVAASFQVYRTYVVAGRGEVTSEDIAAISKSIEQAKEHRQDIDAGLYDFIGEILTLRAAGPLENEFAMRFQQFTSPVMAKGVEDTAFYCFNRMVGLNEVGANPGGHGASLEEFHSAMASVQNDWPYTMTTLSTHDTKRADDVRARLAVLTEAPGRWASFVTRSMRRNKPFRTGAWPDPNTEYFLYQTLVGAWPISEDRLLAYMEKASREAKQQTSWTQPNKDFEQALRSFIQQILASRDFLQELEALVAHLQPPARMNSLSQTLIKFMSPGVPDTYQGGELWDLSLVDPDNRRPVDFDERRALLAELKSGIAPDQILRRADSGLPKLWTAHVALTLRNAHPEWFGDSAGYEPIVATGPKKDHLVAFLRGGAVAVLAPRWSLRLAGKWSGTTVTLPFGRWTNILANESFRGDRMRVQDLLARFPVALLVRESD